MLQAQLQGKDAKDDLATKLKKQMLWELFPNLDRDVLLEVFAAHGNSFEETVDEVMVSTGDTQEEHVRTVIAPEALVAHERSLMEQAKQEQGKVDQENKVCILGTSVSLISLLPWLSRSSPWLVRLGFVVDRVALEHIFQRPLSGTTRAVLCNFSVTK